MSSDERAPAHARPMWVRIALGSFISFGLLFTLLGALVMFATLRHHVNEYHETLSNLMGDLMGEYRECSGDASFMERCFAEDAETHGKENVFLLITYPSGEVKASSSSNAFVLSEMIRLSSCGSTTYRIQGETGDGGPRPLSVRVRKSGLEDGCVLSVGCNVTKDELHAMRLGVVLGSSLVFVWFVGAGLGAFFARRITSPLRKIAAAADDISRGDYSARVPPTSEGWEIAELEHAFNLMAESNEKTLSELRTLTDDIAHDLRTPLTRLRAAAETEIMGGERTRSLAEDVCEETTAMLDMINTMLDISQTESRIKRTPRERIEMSGFVKNVLELYSVLAEESQVDVTATLPGKPVYLMAHKGRLQQMMGNLLDNALKFTPRGGRIEVKVSTDPFTLSVANTGPGIAAKDLPHIFQRFWRADESRSLPGNGLGLALVKAIAVSYGGDVTCESTPGGWTVFTICGIDR